MAKMYIIKKFSFINGDIEETTITDIPLLPAKDAIQVVWILNSNFKGTDTLYQIAPIQAPLMK